MACGVGEVALVVSGLPGPPLPNIAFHFIRQQREWQERSAVHVQTANTSQQRLPRNDYRGVLRSELGNLAQNNIKTP